MKDFEAQGGIAFFLIHYTGRDSFYYLTFRKLLGFWERSGRGGRKSFRYEETEEKYFIKPAANLYLPYLDAIQTDLDERDGEGL